MKKEVNKIVLVIGFVVAIVGLWISAIAGSLQYVFNSFSVSMIAAVLAFGFIFSSNKVLKIIGYSFNALVGAQGVRTIILMEEYIRIGELVTSIGYAIMALATLIYFVAFLLAFFGFVKKYEKAEATCLYTELARYKELLEDGILTEEEFVELKQKALAGQDAKEAPAMDDLKKWKKMLDQQIISEDEFASIKKNILVK